MRVPAERAAAPQAAALLAVVLLASALGLPAMSGCARAPRAFESALSVDTGADGSAQSGAPTPGVDTTASATSTSVAENSGGVPEDGGATGDAGVSLSRKAPLRVDPAGFGFDAAAAIRHAATIASYGVRQGGSTAERKAAEYVAAELVRLGLEPVYQEFAIPGGGTSVNVIATVPGLDDSRRFLAGGHLDSKPPSPGANDNASGCGVLLELARILAENPPPIDVELVFWGSEEFLPEGVDSHHLGSRRHASGLNDAERDRLVGALSVDMVGVGTSFHVRTMERGPQTLRRMMLADAKADGVPMSFLKDRGRTGWSDHEPYELRGVPAAWLEWQDDPSYHTARDTADKLSRRPMQVTGEFLTGFVYRLDDARIRSLDEGR